MRVFNRLFALVIGVALAAAGVLVVIEAVWAWTNSGFVWIDGRNWLHAFRSTPWSSHIVIGVCIGVAAFGFILFVAEVRPQRKRHAVFATDAATYLLLRRSTEKYLQRRLANEIPVNPIKVRLIPRRLRWRLTISAKAASSTQSTLRGAGLAELPRLHAPSPSTVRVITTRSKEAS